MHAGAATGTGAGAKVAAVRGRVGAACTLAMILAGCAGRPRPLDDPDRWRAGECRARFTIEHEGSPAAELRELGGWRDGVQDRFPAAVVDPATQRPVAATAHLRLASRPIAWFSPALDVVVLDGAAFTPLRGVDATQAAAGTRQAVGRVVPRARQAMGDRAVLELLLRIAAIQSYWQVGADLCVTEEHEAHGAYRAVIAGVHQYVLVHGSRTHEARFAFVVEIDPEGEVTVMGREPPSSERT